MKNQKGFAVLGSVLLVVLALLIGGVGYYLYNTNKTDNDYTTTETTEPANEPAITDFVITEWGIKMSLAEALKDPTYRIITDEPNLKPVAVLSTDAIDNSATCKEHAAESKLSFQYIERLALADMVALDESGQDVVAAAEMPAKSGQFKQVGDYVYRFHHGNGFACEDGGNEAFAAYQAAFKTLQEVN
jgi:hypothetical protein